MKALFAAVRKICPAGAWSEGVTLARQGAVSIERRDAEEIVARVTLAGAAMTPTVALYPEDLEWECDCASPLAACAHVAGSVIALQQGTAASARTRPIEYRFRRTREGLVLERGVEDENGFHLLEVALDVVASGTSRDLRFDATPEDLEIEKALDGPPERLLGALSRCDRVTLDGEPVRCVRDAVLPHVVVEDERDGFVLRLDESVGVSERFRNGFVLVGSKLHPEGEPPLTGRERHDLARERFYRPSDVGELVGVILPALREKLPVDVRTKRLPGAVVEPPRLSFFSKREGDRLYVSTHVVYGDPPRARLEGDRLVALDGEVPLRDLEAEKRLEEVSLRKLGLRLGRGEELETETAIELVARLDDFEGVVEGQGHEDFRLYEELEPSVAFEGGGFDVRFRSGGKTGDPKEVLRVFRAGSSLVPLVGGGFAPLPLDWLSRYGERLADLLAAREAGRGKLPKASLADLGTLAKDLDAPVPPSLDVFRDFEKVPAAPLPDELAARLRTYQREGVDRLVWLRRSGMGGVLADDMGLGKTLQALCAVEGRTLVVAPTSVLRNWQEEAARFRPELSVAIYHGRERELDAGADVTITSHALLRRDRDVLSAIDWDTVVFDEAQAMKNPESQLARAAYALRAGFRVSLTGTPIENRLVDLWSQLHFVNPGFLGGLADFEERYVRPIERGERDVLDRLRERIRPFFVRRLKRDVAPELPPRTEITLHAELGEEERRVYETVRLAARKDVLAKLEKGGNVLAALEALLRLRQAACHPALVPGQRAETSSKTELLLSQLETASADEHKSLVFSQWTSMLDLLEPHLTERGLSFVRLDGSTKDRASVVDRFQTDAGVPVFLVSLKAGGVGLNLTAADHVFLFDPWWNPAVEEQAFDRAHRIGQDKPVFVHRLVADDTVEERIVTLQEEKRSLATLAAGAGLTREDVLRLID